MRHRVAINCTDITPTCLVEDTIYGYYPSLPLNAFFIAVFTIFAILQFSLGLKYRTYFYGTVITFGAIGEAIGYGGRIIMHSNPYSSLGFKIQISCLIFSPAYIAAGIYLTLQYVVLTFGEKTSRIPASWYTWIFITCDFLSLMLQAVGGGLAGGAGENAHLRDIGTNAMIAGIVWQVFTLVAFVGLVVDYVVRTRRNWVEVPEAAKMLLRKTSFRCFVGGVAVAFATVFCRCVYRIAEMVGGWANPIMRDQTGFVVMEGFMIVVAVLVLTLFHPGYCFPQLSKKTTKRVSAESSVNGESFANQGITLKVGEKSATSRDGRPDEG